MGEKMNRIFSKELRFKLVILAAISAVFAVSLILTRRYGSLDDGAFVMLGFMLFGAVAVMTMAFNDFVWNLRALVANADASEAREKAFNEQTEKFRRVFAFTIAWATLNEKLLFSGPASVRSEE